MICAWHRATWTAHLPPLSNVSLTSWSRLQEQLKKETHYPVLYLTLPSTVTSWSQLDWSVLSPLHTLGFESPLPQQVLLTRMVCLLVRTNNYRAVRLISAALLCDPCTSHTRYTSPVRPTDVHVPLVTWPAEARAGPHAVPVPLVYQDTFLSFGSETYELKSKIFRPWRKFWDIKHKSDFRRDNNARCLKRGGSIYKETFLRKIFISWRLTWRTRFWISPRGARLNVRSGIHCIVLLIKIKNTDKKLFLLVLNNHERLRVFPCRLQLARFDRLRNEGLRV